MIKLSQPALADTDNMLFWTFLFRVVSVMIVMFTVSTRPTLPAWMAQGYQLASYPLLVYSLASLIFRKHIGLTLSRYPALVYIDLVIAVSIIQLGGSWRSSYFAYTVSAIMLFTIFDGKRGAYISAGVLAVSAFIKDPSGGLPSFDIFFIDNRDMRVGGVLFYAGTGIIFGYFYVLLQKLEQMSQAQVEETRKRTAMEEKNRMALDLHDGAKQMVNAMLLKMNPLVKKMQTSHDSTADELRWIWRGMNYLKNEFDQVMEALREGGRANGLACDIVSVVEEEGKVAETMTGFRWRVSSEISGTFISPRNQLPLRRFLGEALMNAWKHSGTADGAIEVRTSNDILVLTIADKGRGFDYANAAEMKTTGLKSLKYRAKELSGNLAIDTAPGKGCKLTLTIPTEAL